MIPNGFALMAASIDSRAAFLLDTALKGAAIFTAAGVLAVALRRRTAAARHLVWSLAVAGVLVLPILSASLPAWWLSLPERRAVAIATADAGGRDGRVETLDRQDRPGSGEAAGLLVDDRRVGPHPAPAPGAGGSSSDHATRLRTLTAGQWVCGIWAGGAVLFLLPTAAGLLSLWRLGRSSQAVPDGPAQQRLARLAAELNLKRPVRLVQNPERDMPMTWGLWRPTVLLPQGWQSWAEDRLDVVLVHELAHVQRRDFVTGLIARLVCALHWGNPLAWLAWTRMRVEQERACDDLALGRGLDPSDYAGHLLAIISRGASRSAHRSLASAMASSTPIERRLRSILDPSLARARHPLRRRQVVLATLAAVILVAPVATGHHGPATTRAGEGWVLELSRGAAQAPVEEADGWLRQKVIIRFGTVLKVGRQVVDESSREASAKGEGRRVLCVYRVEQVNGPWLWLVPRREGRSGWARAAQVVPYDDAIDYYTGEIHAHPRASKAYVCRATLWCSRKQYDNAMADCDEAIRLDPASAQALAVRAHVWGMKDNNTSAMADCDEAIRLDPRLADAYVTRSNAWSSRHDLDRATADCNEAIRLDPRSARAYTARGAAWEWEEEHDKAIADLNEAIRLDPEYAAAYLIRGEARKAMNETERALADFSQAIRLDPENADAHFDRGKIRRSRHEYDMAAADFSEAIRLEPSQSSRVLSQVLGPDYHGP